MSNLQSTLFSSTPIIEGNSVTLPIVKTGTKAYNSTGKAFTLTKCALESCAESWIDGIATVNHKVQVDGKISEAWFKDPYVYATFGGLSQETIDVINSPAYRGVSQESMPLTIVNSTDVTELKGTGCTFVIFPEKPACSIAAGCGVIASTTVAVSEDEERHDFDIATVNNAGTRVKVREMSVWLYGEDRKDPEGLKRRITQEVGFSGLGIYFVYDGDESLSLGDEIPDDREPKHTVTINVSNSPIFNFPLYTSPENVQLNSSGGIDLSDNEKTTQLESTLKQKDVLISTRDQEIADLKSTVTKLEGELKTKDEGMASTVQAAVKAALESHDAEFMVKQEHEAAVKDLSSFMKEDTLGEFLKAKPSVEVIKSTTAALKASAAMQVGAESGDSPDTPNLVSIHDEWNEATGGNQ